MQAPHVKTYRPDTLLMKRVSAYLAVVVGRRRDEVALYLPKVMPLWGKMRIRHGGDAIWSMFITRRQGSAPIRNSSAVRVSRSIMINSELSMH
jgi:hypothetical protein